MWSVKNIKAVGFDVDGTLYHSSEAMSIAVGKILIERAAKELARDVDELAEEYLSRRDEFRSNTLTLNSFGLDGQKIFQAVWDDIAVEKYVIKDPKLVEMMAKLKKKYILFLISNGTGAQIERKLSYLGLDYHDFEPRIYCYDQGWVKPEPAPFLAAIEALELRPEEIVYVGDREDVDIEGAKAVGMKTILIGHPSSYAQGSQDASCENIYELAQLFTT